MPRSLPRRPYAVPCQPLVPCPGCQPPLDLEWWVLTLWAGGDMPNWRVLVSLSFAFSSVGGNWTQRVAEPTPTQPLRPPGPWGGRTSLGVQDGCWEDFSSIWGPGFQSPISLQPFQAPVLPPSASSASCGPPPLPPSAITVASPCFLLPQHSQVSPRGRQTLYPFKKKLWPLCQQPLVNTDSSQEAPVCSGGRVGHWSREWPSAPGGTAFPLCSSSFWWSGLGHVTQFLCVSVSLICKLGLITPGSNNYY